jgi:hypothetical protein
MHVLYQRDLQYLLLLGAMLRNYLAVVARCCDASYATRHSVGGITYNNTSRVMRVSRRLVTDAAREF